MQALLSCPGASTRQAPCLPASLPPLTPARLVRVGRDGEADVVSGLGGRVLLRDVETFRGASRVDQIQAGRRAGGQAGWQAGGQARVTSLEIRGLDLSRLSLLSRGELPPGKREVAGFLDPGILAT